MKIRPVGAEFFHADGRTDMTKLILAVRNFAYELKNQQLNIFCELNIIHRIHFMITIQNGESNYITER
jgi:hypothetical protein